MEVIPAEPAGDVHRFANGIKAGDFGGLHRAAGKFGGGDAACGDFGFGEAFGAIGGKAPIGQPRLCAVQGLVGNVAQFTIQRQPVSQRIGQPRGQGFAQDGAQMRARAVTLGRDQPVGLGIGQEGDRHLFTMPPIAGDLQDRRAGQALVGEQRGLGKFGLSRARPHRGGDA